jgi:hypothetical protein
MWSDADAQRYAAGRITQSGPRRVEGDRIWMTTRVQLHAPPDDVVAALLGDWRRWWRHGVVEAAAPPADLPAAHFDGAPFVPAMTFGFKPVRHLIRVVLTITHPIRSRADGVDSYRMPVDLRGHFVGPGDMIVTARPDGGSVLVSRWTGMRNASLLPTRLAAAMHFKAENGTSPLQHHTGYVGLISYLERRDRPASPARPLAG